MSVESHWAIRPGRPRFSPDPAGTASANGRPSAGPVPLRGLLISAGALVAAMGAGARRDTGPAGVDPGRILGIRTSPSTRPLAGGCAGLVGRRRVGRAEVEPGTGGLRVDLR